MDHHGLLGCLRRLELVRAQTHRPDEAMKWSWRYKVLITPELRCPWCEQHLRATPWIFFFDMVSQRYIGQIKVETGNTCHIQAPDHPNAGGSGHICFGFLAGYQATDIIHAFLSPSLDHNLGGYGEAGLRYLMRWMKRYWDHGQEDCKSCPKELHSKYGARKHYKPTDHAEPDAAFRRALKAV